LNDPHGRADDLAHPNRAGPGDLLLTFRPYLTVAGSLALVAGIGQINSLSGSWGGGWLTEPLTHTAMQLALGLHVLSYLSLLVGVVALEKHAPLARWGWLGFAVLSIAGVAAMAWVNLLVYQSFGIGGGMPSWWMYMLGVTRAMPFYALPLVGGLFAVASRGVTSDQGDAPVMRPHLAPTRLRVAAVIVATAACVTSSAFAGQVVIMVYQWGLRALSFLSFESLGLLFAIATAASLAGAAVALGTALGHRGRPLVVATVVEAIAALLCIALTYGRSIEPFIAGTSSPWQAAVALAGFGKHLVFALLSIAVVRRYARASRQTMEPSGRAFEPVLSTVHATPVSVGLPSNGVGAPEL
jgi:hypothetical protein